MTVGYAGAPAIDVAARARARDTALSCASGSTSRRGRTFHPELFAPAELPVCTGRCQRLPEELLADQLAPGELSQIPRELPPLC